MPSCPMEIAGPAPIAQSAGAARGVQPPAPARTPTWATMTSPTAVATPARSERPAVEPTPRAVREPRSGSRGPLRAQSGPGVRVGHSEAEAEADDSDSCRTGQQLHRPVDHPA